MEKFIDWYNDSEGEKKLLRVSVSIFMASAILEGIAAVIKWLK